VVDYEEDVRAALDKLRQRVFESGQFNGAQRNPSTPEEALELSGEDGTRSILDISKIAAKPDYCCAAPLTAEELDRYFGTDRPTLEMAETNEAFWEGISRGMARYVVIYEGDNPAKLYFAGYSFD
jgi:hypothetical protein